MRVRVSDTAYLDDLIAFLRHAEYLVEQVADDALLVSPVPRSRAVKYARMDLDLLLRAWEVAHPRVKAEQA